jgi:hypothetical protein
MLKPLMRTLGTGGFINPISPLVRRECFERYPFDEKLFLEGEMIFFRFALGFEFQFDPTPTVVMRDHERNLGRSVRKNYDYILRGFESLGRHPEFPAEARGELEALRLRTWRGAGWQGVRVVDDPKWARSMYFNAIRASYLQLLHPKVLLGLGMSLLPDQVRRRLNHEVAKLRRVEGFNNFVAED